MIIDIIYFPVLIYKIFIRLCCETQLSYIPVSLSNVPVFGSGLMSTPRASCCLPQPAALQPPVRAGSQDLKNPIQLLCSQRVKLSETTEEQRHFSYRVLRKNSALAWDSELQLTREVRGCTLPLTGEGRDVFVSCGIPVLLFGVSACTALCLEIQEMICLKSHGWSMELHQDFWKLHPGPFFPVTFLLFFN